MNRDLKLNLTLRLALFAVIVGWAVWHKTENDIRTTCGDSQACLAASL